MEGAGEDRVREGGRAGGEGGRERRKEGERKGRREGGYIRSDSSFFNLKIYEM